MAFVVGGCFPPKFRVEKVRRNRGFYLEPLRGVAAEVFTEPCVRGDK